MRPCLKAEEISRDLKMKLPIIDELTVNMHFCTVCPYYAGRVNGVAHCMQVNCAWEDADERFSPVLRRMLPGAEMELKMAQEAYLQAKQRCDLLKSMFVDEEAEERRRNDTCFGCAYGVSSPCIGFCYKQRTANPVEVKKQK